jgi:hypothetical protein
VSDNLWSLRFILAFFNQESSGLRIESQGVV